MIDILIFSKNRVDKLHFLLDSIAQHFDVGASIYVLYKGTAHKMRDGYRHCEKKFPHVAFIEETEAFSTHVKRIISGWGNRHCLFLCDDNVFINTVTKDDLQNALNKYEGGVDYHSLSLRMTPTTSYCQPAGKEMEIPKLEDEGPQLFSWNWQEAKDQHTCWGYPMAINTHIYRVEDIKAEIMPIEFTNANTLEAALNGRRWTGHPLMLSFKERKIFDVNNSKVNNTDDFNMIDLLNYMGGMRITGISDYAPNSSHGTASYKWQSIGEGVEQTKEERKLEESIVLTTTQEQQCIRTISSLALAKLVADKVKKKLPLSVIRMSDGEKAYIEYAQSGKRSSFMDDAQWLTRYGTLGKNPKAIGESLLLAGEYADYLSCPMLGFENENFDVFQYFPERKAYVDQFFPQIWAAMEMVGMVITSGKCLVLHRDHENVVNQLRGKYGGEIEGMSLNSWADHESLLAEVNKHDAQLVLVAGGAAGKEFCVTLATESGKMVLDIGEALTSVWTQDYTPIMKVHSEHRGL